jgi:hypothetical protein
MSHSYIVKKYSYCLYLTLYWETVALEIDSTSGWLLDHCLDIGNTAVHDGRIRMSTRGAVRLLCQAVVTGTSPHTLLTNSRRECESVG